MLRVSSVLGNRQRLDGGAMFGNVPRALWSRWCAPDELGRIELACRAFLVEDGERRVLIETGIGAFFDPKHKERFGVVEREHVLLDSLGRRGVRPEDIDVVLLSHLHFDHAGGLLSAYPSEPSPGWRAELVFPRARFVVGEVALERARRPHPRDRASFVPELLELLDRSGRMVVVPAGASEVRDLGARIFLRESHGHTPGMLLPELRGRATRALFAADLVPGRAWVHLPVTMGYDRFPELLIDEKRSIYEALGEGSLLLFTHDSAVAAARLSGQGDRFGTTGELSELGGLDLDSPLARAPN